MQINSNMEHLNKIKQSPLGIKYPQLIPIALTYTLLQGRAEHLDGAFYSWFPWGETKEGRKYWMDIGKTL